MVMREVLAIATIIVFLINCLKYELNFNIKVNVRED